jgi:beta-1,4-mannosyltransferase
VRILVPQLEPEAAGGNPELHLLYAAMRRQEAVEVKQFTRWDALRGDWDIVHFYWPEWSVRRSRGSAILALDMHLLFNTLRIAKKRGLRVVWSLNNFLPHEPDARGLIDRYVQTFARYVDHAICSSQTLLEEFLRHYPILRRVDARIVPSSHYLGVYPDEGLTRDEARRALNLPSNATIILSLGMLRRYKNIRYLISCFEEIAESRPDAFLLIAGPALDDGYGAQVTRAAQGSDRVRVDLEYVESGELQYYLRAADCLAWPTVLPGNSSTALLALSYDCPILVPSRGAFVEMADELGEGWVRTYTGGLRPAALARALEPRPAGSVALDPRRSWDAAAAEYLAVYKELVEARG